ncbi:hypothetical protein [Desertihabitans aurantiacus]|uniref:hypothetical protein n=1 Tax=Desertihabitans aurantiacus TaxID=2282477 RepID=UPI0013001759|nr:hypothetical protein [Desertihabitans aurantiacus]
MGTTVLAEAATNSDRYGPFFSAADCESGRDAVAEESDTSYSRIGGCYQMGPGAAGWYFEAYP